MSIIVGPSTITINHNDRFLIAQPDATMTPTDDVGFFGRDTRFVSGYRLTINGRAPILLDASRIEHFSARHEFTSPELPLGSGVLGANAPSLPARSIGLRLDRSISDGIHEDYDLTSYAAIPVRLNPRGRDPVGLRGHLRRALEEDRAPREPPDGLAPGVGRAPNELSERHLPARPRRQGRQGRLPTAVRQRQPRLRRPARTQGHVACLPALAAGHRPAPGTRPRVSCAAREDRQARHEGPPAGRPRRRPSHAAGHLATGRCRHGGAPDRALRRGSQRVRTGGGHPWT